MKFITGRLAVRVSLFVNVCIFLVMAAGTYFLIVQQSNSLESELLNRGNMQSVVGAKMIAGIMEEAIDSGVFSVTDAFDTDYQQIGNFDPPKYHTKYDTYLDKAILGIQDEFLEDESVVYAVAVDQNGYLPTHNTRYQNAITGDVEKDRVGNRTKRVFNDPVGAKAAKNTKKGLLQTYLRDTGETMWDVSSPIYVKGKHWGGFRIGLSLDAINKAKKRLMNSLIVTMCSILAVSFIMTFVAANGALKPLRRLTDTATALADGKNLEKEIKKTRNDEIGSLEAVLERLRMSMIIALKRKKG